MKRFYEICKGRFRRFLYLLFIGMWRGECAYDHYENDCLVGIASARPGPTFWEMNHVREWWTAEGRKLWWAKSATDHPWKGTK